MRRNNKIRPGLILSDLAWLSNGVEMVSAGKGLDRVSLSPSGSSQRVFGSVFSLVIRTIAQEWS